MKPETRLRRVLRLIDAFPIESGEWLPRGRAPEHVTHIRLTSTRYYLKKKTSITIPRGEWEAMKPYLQREGFRPGGSVTLFNLSEEGVKRLKQFDGVPL